jgi:hypothetical protein
VRVRANESGARYRRREEPSSLVAVIESTSAAAIASFASASAHGALWMYETASRISCAGRPRGVNKDSRATGIFFHSACRTSSVTANTCTALYKEDESSDLPQPVAHVISNSS